MPGAWSAPIQLSLTGAGTEAVAGLPSVAIEVQIAAENAQGLGAWSAAKTVTPTVSISEGTFEPWSATDYTPINSALYVIDAAPDQTAANDAELATAIAALPAGGTIRLTGASYAYAFTSVRPTGPLVIEAATLGAATFTAGLALVDCRDVTVRGCVCTGDRLAIRGSERCVLEYCTTPNYNTGEITGSVDCGLRNSSTGRGSIERVINADWTRVFARNDPAATNQPDLINITAYVRGLSLHEVFAKEVKPGSVSDHPDLIQAFFCDWTYGNITRAVLVDEQDAVTRGCQGIFLSDANGEKYRKLAILQNAGAFELALANGITLSTAREECYIAQNTLGSNNRIEVASETETGAQEIFLYDNVRGGDAVFNNRGNIVQSGNADTYSLATSFETDLTANPITDWRSLKPSPTSDWGTTRGLGARGWLEVLQGNALDASEHIPVCYTRPSLEGVSGGDVIAVGSSHTVNLGAWENPGSHSFEWTLMIEDAVELAWTPSSNRALTIPAAAGDCACRIIVAADGGTRGKVYAMSDRFYVSAAAGGHVALSGTPGELVQGSAADFTPIPPTGFAEGDRLFILVSANAAATLPSGYVDRGSVTGAGCTVQLWERTATLTAGEVSGGVTMPTVSSPGGFSVVAVSFAVTAPAGSLVVNLAGGAATQKYLLKSHETTADFADSLVGTIFAGDNFTAGKLRLPPFTFYGGQPGTNSQSMFAAFRRRGAPGNTGLLTALHPSEINCLRASFVIEPPGPQVTSATTLTSPKEGDAIVYTAATFSGADSTSRTFTIGGVSRDPDTYTPVFTDAGQLAVLTYSGTNVYGTKDSAAQALVQPAGVISAGSRYTSFSNASSVAPNAPEAVASGDLFLHVVMGRDFNLTSVAGGSVATTGTTHSDETYGVAAIPGPITDEAVQSYGLSSGSNNFGATRNWIIIEGAATVATSAANGGLNVDTVTVSLSVQAGDRIVVFVDIDSSLADGAIISIGDDAGGYWAFQSQSTGGTNWRSDCWFSKASATGTLTITVGTDSEMADFGVIALAVPA